MFKYIEVYKDHKRLSYQYFNEGITMLPQKGDYITITGMSIGYRVKFMEFNYKEGIIKISVE